MGSLDHLYTPKRGTRSRSINAENPSGAPGSAATTASALGPSRKGRPSISIAQNEAAVLADVEGPGVIRHIWITCPDKTAAGPWVLRDLVLRIFWDDSPNCSVQVPLGDFFCNGFGTRAVVVSDPIVVAPTGGMNSYFSMPFRERARIELVNEHGGTVEGIYFQIDYSVGDELPIDVARFHAQWRRSNGSSELGTDFVVVDGIRGFGQYVGTYIALTALERYWWGEGEMKFYIDADTDYPSQCSTGLEDYAGGAWAFQDAMRVNPPPAPVTFSAPFCGYPYYSATDTSGASPFTQATSQSHGMYRWHIPDPIIFEEGLRVELQQIGAWDFGHFERNDDIAAVSYWYQVEPSAPFPPLPSAMHRRPR
jgi:hypothetical protein